MENENDSLNMEIAEHTHGRQEQQVECPDCGGEKKFNVSTCCFAPPKNGSDDYMICPSCKDHCDYGVICETCKGVGTIAESLIGNW